VQRIPPTAYFGSQQNQDTTIMLRDRWPPGTLPFEHYQLLTQKRVFGDQILLTAEQIARHAGELTIRRWFGPHLHLCFELLKTVHSQLFACVPELTPVHRRFPFRDGEEKNSDFVSDGDYTHRRRNITPDGQSSRHRQERREVQPSLRIYKWKSATIYREKQQSKKVQSPGAVTGTSIVGQLVALFCREALIQQRSM
jgi:hypothetical protein